MSNILGDFGGPDCEFCRGRFPGNPGYFLGHACKCYTKENWKETLTKQGFGSEIVMAEEIFDPSIDLPTLDLEARVYHILKLMYAHEVQDFISKTEEKLAEAKRVFEVHKCYLSPGFMQGYPLEWINYEVACEAEKEIKELTKKLEQLQE